MQEVVSGLHGCPLQFQNDRCTALQRSGRSRLQQGQHRHAHATQFTSAHGRRQRFTARQRRSQRLICAASSLSDGTGYSAGLPPSDLGVDAAAATPSRYTNEFMAFLQAGSACATSSDAAVIFCDVLHACNASGLPHWSAEHAAHQSFVNAMQDLPWRQALIWGIVVFSAYQMKDFFGIAMGTFIVSFIGNGFVQSAQHAPILDRLSPTARRRSMVPFKLPN